MNKQNEMRTKQYFNGRNGNKAIKMGIQKETKRQRKKEEEKEEVK
jgi:hypothetical protein